MAQGVRMAFVRMLIKRMTSVRMHLMRPIEGRERLLGPMLDAVFNAVQMSPKRGLQRSRLQQGVQPNRQA